MTDRVLLDTNVLIAAVDRDRPGHLAARRLVESDPRALAITGQNLREFLVALTRPRANDGYGQTGPTAVAYWSEVSATLDSVEETRASRQLLASLVAGEKAVGKQVHDANLVAVAIEHGARAIVTASPRHFARFADLIEIEALN